MKLDDSGAIVEAGRADPATCDHYWVPNSGRGGEPDYRAYFPGTLTMHVTCAKCNSRTWFTKEQWHAIPVAAPPHRNAAT